MIRLRWLARPIFVGLLLGNLHPSILEGQGGLATLSEVHMGMEVRVVIPEGPDAIRIAGAAFDRIEALDLILSDWRANSELRRVTAAPRLTWRPISPELAELLSLALDVARATDGAFDPTVGPLTLLWRAARDSGVPPADSARQEAQSRVGWWFVELDPQRQRVRFARDDMRLDLGAIAKGWILDQAANSIRAAGETAFLIEAGGDLVVGDPQPNRGGWLIGIVTEHGDSVASLSNQALSTSGPSAQWIVGEDGLRHSHVIDLRRGVGSTSARQVTVVGPRGALTDALATAFTLVGRDRWPALAARFGVNVIAATAD